MIIQELISFYKKKDWDNLLPILTSNITDLSIKILVSAIIETYHPDREQAHNKGLSCWENQLSGNIVSPLLSLISSEVDLTNFGRAFYSAKNLLNDSLVANAIKDFVRKHKLVLGQRLLRDEEIPDQFKQDIREAFGDLRASRYERETQARQQQSGFKEEMTKHLKAVDEIKKRLAPVLNLKARLFSVSFEEPQHPKASKSSFSRYPEIDFDESIKTEEFEALEKQLATCGLKTKTYDMSRLHGEGASRGIQIFSENSVSMAQKLRSAQTIKSSPEDQHEAHSPSI